MTPTNITEKAEEEMTPADILKIEIIQANRQKEITWEQRVDLLQYVELGGVQDAAEQLDEWRITA